MLKLKWKDGETATVEALRSDEDNMRKWELIMARTFEIKDNQVCFTVPLNRVEMLQPNEIERYCTVNKLLHQLHMGNLTVHLEPTNITLQITGLDRISSSTDIKNTLIVTYDFHIVFD